MAIVSMVDRSLGDAEYYPLESIRQNRRYSNMA